MPGRGLEIADWPDVDAITTQLAEADYGFRSLIELVVVSPSVPVEIAGHGR